MTTRQVKAPILLIEDSLPDREAALRGCAKAGIENPIVHCWDGDEALDYLYRRSAYRVPGAATRPALILLDINLPGIDGHEVLTTIKTDMALVNIPVIVMTTSQSARDVQRCYHSGANACLEKPVDTAQFYASLKMLKSFWLDCCLLPLSQEAVRHGE